MRNPPITRVVANNVNRLMVAFGHSNVSLERATHGLVKKSTIGRIRNAEISAGIANVEAIARAFNMAAWQLLVSENDASVPRGTEDRNANAGVQVDEASAELLCLFLRLDERDRSLLLADARKYLVTPRIEPTKQPSTPLEK